MTPNQDDLENAVSILGDRIAESAKSANLGNDAHQQRMRADMVSLWACLEQVSTAQATQ